MRPIPPLPALAVTLALAAGTISGCTLIDQRTFERTPPAPTADTAALPARPLLTIPFDQPDPAWRPALAQAVETAQAHDPNAQFEVSAPIPTLGSPAEQDRFLRQGAADAETIANGLAALGVPPERVHIALRGDTGNPPREVRVYLR